MYAEWIDAIPREVNDKEGDNTLKQPNNCNTEVNLKYIVGQRKGHKAPPFYHLVDSDSLYTCCRKSTEFLEETRVILVQ